MLADDPACIRHLITLINCYIIIKSIQGHSCIGYVLTVVNARPTLHFRVRVKSDCSREKLRQKRIHPIEW